MSSEVVRIKTQHLLQLRNISEVIMMGQKNLLRNMRPFKFLFKRAVKIFAETALAQWLKNVAIKSRKIL